MQNKEFNYFCQIFGFDWQLRDYINFELDFKNFTVSNQTIIDFSKCKLINLQFLNLKKYSIGPQNDQITDLGIYALLENELPKLKTLDTSNNKINMSILAILKRKFQNIYASNCLITAKSLKEIINNNIMLPRKISLSSNNIGSTGLKLLLKADMSHTQQLQLNCCKIGYEGHKHIIKAKFCRLEILHIKSEIGVQFCYQSIYCKQLLQIQFNMPVIFLLQFMSTISSPFLKKISSKQNLNGGYKKLVKTVSVGLPSIFLPFSLRNIKGGYN